MTLTLTVIRCPEGTPPETRHVSGGEFTIGRGPGNDWVLADPERQVSKRHCIVAYRAGAWQIADTSTNGTFLNRDPEPVGADVPRPLRHGDRVRIGAYEIEVVLVEDAPAARWQPDAPAARWQPDAAPPDPFGPSPFGEDPFAPQQPARPAPGIGADPFAAGMGAAGGGDIAIGGTVGLPADFDPLAPEPDAPFAGPVQADHAPFLEDSFRPPQPASSMIPDDWDLDLSPQPPAPSMPQPAPVLQAPPTPSPLPVAPLPAAPLPVAPPPPAPTVPPDAEPVAPDAALAAFMRGAGMAGAPPPDALAAMEALGGAFRALVSGIRRTLIARATIKGEFRIEQTMIQARGNNPLKFSADDDDALAALTGTGRRGDMAPAAAVADALRDIRLHELATVAAMQSAVRELLARFDPAPLRRAAEQGGMALPGQKKARAWDSFEELYGQVSQALSDDFDSVFGRAFARAYERATADLSVKDSPE